MIQLNNINDINTSTDEGKLLISAIAVLTSINTKQLDPLYKETYNGYNWGSNVHPDTALIQIVDLANHLYHPEEHKLEVERYQKIINRDEKINTIINPTL